MSFTLFELNARIAEVVDRILEADLDDELEADDPLYEELDGLFEARTEKHEKYVHVIKNAEYSAEAAKAEAAAFSARAKALENLSRRLKETLRLDLHQYGEKSTTAGSFKIARQNGAPRVVVRVEPEELPTDYQRVRVEADKTALKTALKNGEEVNGVELESTEHVRIRVK